MIFRIHVPVHNRARLLCALGVTLAACVLAGSSLAAADRTSAARPAYDPAQILRFSEPVLAGSISPPVFDPVKARTGSAIVPWGRAIYSTLLRYTPNGKLAPELATRVVVVNGRTIDIGLRTGVRFSDGAPFNATAVKFGLERNAKTQSPLFQPALLSLERIEVRGSHSLRVTLGKPLAGAFVESLAYLPDSFIVSPRAATNPSIDLNVAPVGAGPYVLTQYVPLQRVVLRKNPTYWNAKNVKLAGVEMLAVSPGPQQVNALKTNLSQLEAQLTVDQVAELKRSGYTTGAFGLDGSHVFLPVCKAGKPFDDLRVRQALNYAIDRDAINRAVYDGNGSPAWALVPRGHRFYPQDLDRSYAYNPARARQLLAAAGYPDGFKTAMYVNPSASELAQVALILQAQWKAVGVDLEIRPTTNYINDLYIRRAAPLGLNPGGVAHLGKLASFQLGTTANLCQYDDPRLTTMINKVSSLAPDNPAAATEWKNVQRYILNNALFIYVVNKPLLAAWHPRLRNVQMLVGSVKTPDIWEPWFARR